MFRTIVPPRHLLLASSAFLVTLASATGQTLYDFGNPTADEQLYIELMNRARANPPLEGARLASTTDPEILAMYSYWKVNLQMMVDEFNQILPTPPLAPNGKLTAAARGHTQWMFVNAVQTHNQTNPSNTAGDRITTAGYNWQTYGENVFSYSENSSFGHAGFEVDWGGPVGGMQSPRGHRNSIHNGNFREVGVGVVNGTNGPVGPQLVTQDFGTSQNSPNFGTGVAYYDLNGNDFYDPGEGIAGLTVTVAGASQYCVSATGGGWAVPIPQNATTRAVTFAGNGINQSRNLVVAASKNAKVDLKLSYTPPSISSPATGAPGNAHGFTFSAVPGAASYKWDRWNVSSASGESCDTTANITSTTTGSYQVLNTAVKHEGTGSFHLAIPAVALSTQVIELKPLYFGGNNPALSFYSQLRLSTSSERYSVQVKEEGTGTWQEVHGQDGGGGETSFSLKNVLMPTFSGKAFRVRFVASFQGGSTYGNAGNDFGWFIDAISFSNLQSLTGGVSQTLIGTSGTFTPTAGDYLLSVTPLIGGNPFPGTRQLFSAVAQASGYASWAAAAETAAGLPAGTLAANPEADHDADGLANLVEYAFGLSPVVASEPSFRLPRVVPSTSHLLVRYVRDPELGDLTVSPVISNDMIHWHAPGDPGAPQGFSDSPVPGEGPLQTREAGIPVEAGSSWFIRVRVTRN